ncbi:hypothetical protein ACFVYC_21700 [Pseudarthrobacter sp. NPDC058329]|uniref:hypothetical protein n=1 Tax=Pseudarthrobacter sp. NPDC058329 TaxID=3346448 RepID=UPI0036DF37C6
MSAAVLGAGVAIFWAVSALLSPAAGHVAQRLGARKGMLLAVIGGLASLSGIAFATPIGHAYSFGWQWEAPPMPSGIRRPTASSLNRLLSGTVP